MRLAFDASVVLHPDAKQFVASEGKTLPILISAGLIGRYSQRPIPIERIEYLGPAQSDQGWQRWPAVALSLISEREVTRLPARTVSSVRDKF